MRTLVIIEPKSPCLRRGREIPTFPQRTVILPIINRANEGVPSQPEYTLAKPSNCPNNRDDVIHRAARNWPLLTVSDPYV